MRKHKNELHFHVHHPESYDTCQVLSLWMYAFSNEVWALWTEPLSRQPFHLHIS